MKLFIVLGLMATSTVFANETTQIECRDAVVNAKAHIGEYISPDSFSSRTFESYNMSANEFNNLTSQAQVNIYMQVKPIEIMVEETVNQMNSYIQRYSNSAYALYFVDTIQEYREFKDALLNCKK